MKHNEKIDKPLEEKLENCLESFEFMSLGFQYQCHISDIDKEYDEDARIDIWSDGYYLIKIIDNGNTHVAYGGQYEREM